MSAPPVAKPSHALVRRWQPPDDPLPVRTIRPAWPAPAPHTGPAGVPFDFCGHVRALLGDIAARCPELGHVNVSRILIGVTQARSPRVHGLQARLTALRFAGGALVRQRRGVTYQVQRYFEGDHEFLYLLTFCLPRFLDATFDDKLVTLVHELYHVSPQCDGALRRHGGRSSLHRHGRHAYDRAMADLARAYIASRPDAALLTFLRLDFAQLQARHGRILGVVVPRPKIIPLPGPATLPR